MISNYPEYYRLVDYLTQFTRGRKIGIILGIYNLKRVMDEKYYEHLNGGILEAFGTLFGNNVKFYVYPSKREGSDEVYSLEDLGDELPPNLIYLFQYLVANDKLEKIKGANVDLLHIVSDNVLAKIKTGQPGWEADVPRKVAEAIKEHQLFDYPSTDVREEQKNRDIQKALSSQKVS